MRTGPLRAVALLFGAAALLPAASRAATCDLVAHCGAVADNATDATAAIVSCLACAGAGGTVTVPASASFRIGSLDLSSAPPNLTLAFGAASGW
jgi:hypothetical protein